MKEYDYDLFVIGAGSGGVRAARTASAYGARVGVAEERYLGGTCVNVGCVPKKLFVYASQFSSEFKVSTGYGWVADKPDFVWENLIEQKNQEIARLNGVYESLLTKAGVQLFDGHAQIVNKHTVQVAEQQLSARYILIAAGGRPSLPDFPGGEFVITSNEAFYLDQLPKSIIIIGGGYIAAEFAGIFNGLGVDTTIVYRGQLFLRGFDVEIRQHLAQQMVAKGINLKFESSIKCIEKAEEGLVAYFVNGEHQHAEQIMYAAGRKPKSTGMGIEALGVDIDGVGAIVVDEHYQTTVSSIYAIGDVTNRINLTPVALAEGMALARMLFGGSKSKPDYSNIPTCVFSQPNLASVGLTQQQAEQEYTEIAVYKSVFRPMKYSLTDIQEQTMVKLIIDVETDRVVGVHMVGPEAGEIIQGIAIAIKAGVTKSGFDSTFGIHPTIAEEFVTM